MKSIFTTFVVILLLVVVVMSAEKPKYPVLSLENTDENVLAVNGNFKDIAINKQNSSFRIFTTTPTTSDMGEGHIALFRSGGAYRIYMKINGLLKYQDLK